MAEELNWSQRTADSLLPAGLELQWLGTSGFRLSYAGHHILIDPYLTRVPLSDVLWRRSTPPSEAVVRAHVSAANAILIGHTHFDHALDTPLIARLHGARVFGSKSTANLMALYDLSPQMVEVEPYRVYDIGPFAASFIPSAHSKLAAGLYVPADGDVSCEHFDDLTPSAYRCGQVWGIHIEVAGTSFYHQGSADLIDDALTIRGVDFFLAGIAGRSFTRRYLDRILRRLDPRVIVPHHHDDFLRPLSAPMEFSFNVGFASFPDEVAAISRDFELRSLHPLQTVGAPSP